MMNSNIVGRFLSAFMLAAFIALNFITTADARFLSPDTWDPMLAGVDINRYAYANDDPVNGSDPNGHQDLRNYIDPERDDPSGFKLRMLNEPSYGSVDPVDPQMQRFIKMQKTLLDGVAGTVIIEVQKPAYRLRSVLSELQDKSGRPTTAMQRSHLADDFKTNKNLVNSVSGGKLDAMRRDFRNQREKLISDWEKNTGRTWPRYSAQDVRDGLGGQYARAGQRYDAHHIRQLSDGGRNTWWNIHPVTASSHTGSGGIHGAGSTNNSTRNFFSRLFGK